jgi:hypothetical protein
MTRLQLIFLQIGVVLLCWVGFRWYYIDVGEDRCEAKHVAAQVKANEAMYAGQIQRDVEAGGIAKATVEQGKTIVAEADKKTEQAVSTVEVVYRDRWRTVPNGKFAHPLDPRVQNEIDQAVQRTN